MFLELIKEEDRLMWDKVLKFLNNYSNLSRIQVNSFILNDVEFPTPYAKFKQAQLELITRWFRLVDVSYGIKELEIKIKMKEREIKFQKDELKKELLLLKKSKLDFQLLSKQRELKNITEEARLFWDIYAKYPQFHDLSDEEAYKLEAEYWSMKTLNMPTIFEERYGAEYMKKAIGEERYKSYLEARQKFMGLLPREMFEKGSDGCSRLDPTRRRGLLKNGNT